jgi:hypothetical protein
MIYVYDDGANHFNCICDGVVKTKPVQKIRTDKYGKDIEYVYFDVIYEYDEERQQFMQITCYVFDRPSVRACRFVRVNTHLLLFGKILVDKYKSRKALEKKYLMKVTSLINFHELYSIVERMHDGESYEAKIMHEYYKQSRKRKPKEINLVGEAEKIITQEDVLL